MTIKKLFEAALHLRPRERELLVEQLIESLRCENQLAADESDRAWLAEIQRRSADIDAGTAELVDWSDVRSRIAARPAQP